MRIVRRLLLGLVVVGVLFFGALAAAAYLVDIPGLIEKYRPQALAQAEMALNRDVELGAVSATWFPTLGLRLEDVRIGDDPLVATSTRAVRPEPTGETFLSLGAVQVGIAVWPALSSLGKRIEVTEIRVESPAVRVVRFEDGSFNFSTLGPPKTAEPEPEPEPADGGFADRLTSASVGEVALVDGAVRFEDRVKGGLGTLEIRHIGFLAKNVGLGLPLEALLTAALRDATEPNLKVEVATGPLASKVSELGAPELRQVKLHADQLPLSIVPVSVEQVILEQAALSADVSVEPGPDGGLTVSGPLSVTALRLRQPAQSPGAPFDVVLGLAVKTSSVFDRFVLEGTEIAVGPLKTRVSGQASTAPEIRWDNVALDTVAPFSVGALAALAPGPRLPVPDGRLSLDLDTSGGLETLLLNLGARLSGLEHTQEGLSARGALALDVSARGAIAAPKVEIRLDAGALAVEGEGFAKPAGMATGVAVDLEVGKERIRIPTAEVRLGDARLAGSGTYPLGSTGRVDVALALDELLLKPFLTQLRLPAESLPEGSKVGLDVRYQASAKDPAAGSVEVPKLTFAAGDSRLTANAAVESFSPVVARVVGRSAYLNLDALMPKTAADPKKEAPPPGDPNEPILPPSMRSARATIDLEVKKLLYQGVEMSNVDVLVRLRDGKLIVESTKVGLFGGRFVADGTTLDLASAPLGYDLVAKLERVRGEEVLKLVADVEDALTGQLDTDFRLSGKGFSPQQLSQSLAGAFSMALSNGSLRGVNVVAAVVDPVEKAIDFARTRGKLNLGEPAVTRFKRLAGSFEVKQGSLQLKAPMTISTSQGDIALEGGMGLDGKLDFTGAFDLPPKLLTQLTGGKVRAKKPVPVRFGLGCSIDKPCVQGVDAQQAAEGLAALAAGKALDSAGRLIEKKTGVDTAKALREAEEAKRRAEEAKRKAEAEARRRAEEAKRKAAAEAARARAEAEAAAQRQAEEAKRKAAEEAKKKLKGLF